MLWCSVHIRGAHCGSAVGSCGWRPEPCPALHLVSCKLRTLCAELSVPIKHAEQGLQPSMV